MRNQEDRASFQSQCVRRRKCFSRRSASTGALCLFQLLEVSVQSRLTRFLSFVSVVTLCLGVSLTANAQRYLGGIQGEVTDSTGAKVSGAAVVAEEASTRFKTAGK